MGLPRKNMKELIIEFFDDKKQLKVVLPEYIYMMWITDKYMMRANEKYFKIILA